jgi:hypothetical protein
MALNARYQKVATAATAAVGATNKVTALVTNLVDQFIDDISSKATLTPSQQNKVAQARAHLVANIASLQTSIGL